MGNIFKSSAIYCAFCANTTAITKKKFINKLIKSKQIKKIGHDKYEVQKRLFNVKP